MALRAFKQACYERLYVLGVMVMRTRPLFINKFVETFIQAERELQIQFLVNQEHGYPASKAANQKVRSLLEE